MIYLYNRLINELGPECKNVKGELVKLLRDETEDVLGALIPSLAEILMHFEAYNILSREAVTMLCFDLYRALVKCHLELFSGHIWRMQEQYLAQLECLPFCLPSDFIYQHFVPFILNDSIDGVSNADEFVVVYHFACHLLLESETCTDSSDQDPSRVFAV